MDIIIIGGGKVGRTLVQELNDEGHAVVLIDLKTNIIDTIQEDFDVMGIVGSGTDIEVLNEAGMNRADLVIAVTHSDELNMLCCIMSKRLGAKHCVARLRNPGYFKQGGFMRKELDIDMIVNPELYAAAEISRSLRFPAVMKVETFAKGRIELVQIKIDSNSPIADKALHEIYSEYKLKVLVCAVERNDEVFIPNGDFILRGDDKIHVTATHRDIAKFMHEIGIDNHPLKTVMLIGGGKISYYLAKQLIESGMRVKVIDQDMNACDVLAELLPKASIICGDGTDKDILAEEGIEDVDALVTLTGIDEENIIVSMYAKNIGVGKVITKINRLSFGDMLDAIGIDNIVTPKEISADVILGYVRAKESSSGTEINSLYRIVSNKAEAIEFNITNEPSLTSMPLKNLKLKKNILIASVVRANKRAFIPDGETTLESGDTVVIVTTNHLKKLTDILA